MLFFGSIYVISRFVDFASSFLYKMAPEMAVVSGDVMGPAVLFCHLAVRRGVMDGPSQKERVNRMEMLSYDQLHYEFLGRP